MRVLCTCTYSQTRRKLPTSTEESLPHKALPRHRPRRERDNVLLRQLTDLQHFVSLSCPRIKLFQTIFCVLCVCVCGVSIQANNKDLIRESTIILSMLFCNKIWVCGHDVVSRSHNVDMQSSLLLGAAQGNGTTFCCDT